MNRAGGRHEDWILLLLHLSRIHSLDAPFLFSSQPRKNLSNWGGFISYILCQLKSKYSQKLQTDHIDTFILRVEFLSFCTLS